MKKYIYILLALLSISCTKQEEIETEVVYRKDLTPVMIIDEKITVGGQLTLNEFSSRVGRTIVFPDNTEHWCFWVGVGQESLQRLQQAVSDISRAGQKITKDPFIAFGLQMLSSLPIITGSDNVNFYFTSAENQSLFLQGKTFRYYTFVQLEQTVNSYRLIQFKDTPNDNRRLYFNMQNTRDFRNLDVYIKVYAFVRK
jgi:hypothetical protein